MTDRIQTMRECERCGNAFRSCRDPYALVCPACDEDVAAYPEVAERVYLAHAIERDDLVLSCTSFIV